MKILLISPSRNTKIKKNKKGLWPPLNLFTIAALTPKDIEVKIVDEEVTPLDPTERADLVALTSMSATSFRAYEIADHFKSKNIPVVMGGMHASIMTDEALKHVDSVVIGEAEGLWQKLINDFLNNNLQKTYKCDEHPSLEKFPHPRRDLLNHKDYFVFNTVQTARGCPYACDFCSVSKFFGKTYRFRPIEDIVEEVKELKKYGKIFGFIDDNIIGNVPRAKKLFKALIPLKIYWGSQATISIGQDEELLYLAKKSGCNFLYIGFETTSKAALAESNKSFNKPEDYKRLIKNIHKYKIPILGSFVIGFDSDSPETVKETIDFAKDAQVDMALFHRLVPLPGTGFYNRMEEQGRIKTKDWSKYWGFTVYETKGMSEEELNKQIKFAEREFYSIKSILKRIKFSTYGKFTPLIWIINLFLNKMGKNYNKGGGLFKTVDRWISHYNRKGKKESGLVKKAQSVFSLTK